MQDAHAAEDNPAPVVRLLRAVAGERRPSMERYADALAAGIPARGAFAVASVHPPQSRFGLLFDRYPGYLRAAGRLDGDLFHIPDHSYAHLLRRLPGARTVVTCHDLIPLLPAELTGVQQGPRARQGFRWIAGHLDRAAAVICVSEATRADVERLLGIPAERLHVVPNAVDPAFAPLDDAERAAAREQLGPGTEIVVLQVSTGGGYKNDEAVAAVIEILTRRGLNVGLLRVGGPNHLNTIDLARAYAAADVLLFPSRYEGFGWPALEAMASGTPVVAGRRGALPEVVGDAGLLAEPDDHSALADAVERALAEREQLRARGLERAATFTSERMLAGVEQVYRTVLG